MSGEHEVDVGREVFTFKQHTNLHLQALHCWTGPQSSRVLYLNSKKSVLRFIAHELVVAPPHVHLTSCHVINVPRPSWFSVAFPLVCIICKLKGKNRGGGN